MGLLKRPGGPKNYLRQKLSTFVKKEKGTLESRPNPREKMLENQLCSSKNETDLSDFQQSQKLSKEYPDEPMTLVGNGAWHRSQKLRIPHHIKRSSSTLARNSTLLNVSGSRFSQRLSRTKFIKPSPTRGRCVCLPSKNLTSGYRQNMRHKFVQLIMGFGMALLKK